MATLGTVLLVLGLAVCTVGGIQILIIAYSKHILWCIGCFLFPVITMLFSILHWSEAKKPFLLYLGGMILTVLGSYLSGNLNYHMSLMGLNIE
jgi:hypothetical protein